MFRLAGLSLILLLSIVSLSCQSYTAGLQQGVARADETAATAALRTIATAQRTYSVSNNGDFGTFQQLCAGDYLDARFNADKPAIKDYVLTMTVTAKAAGQPEGSFSCNADPVGTGAQAGRHFYIDSTSSALHANANQPATANDPITQP
jgi:Tfp pilus assembly protein PilE